MSGIGGAVLGMMGGMYGATNQHRRQKALMGTQYQHQRMLNQQGHELQHEMWKKTNYPAQVRMMKEAGLNPALMYGSAGQGGSTGSQGGGSASGGQASPFNPMDVSNMMKLKAETELLNAQKDNVDKDTELKDEGVKKTVQETAKVVAEKLNVEQQLSESKQRELNLETERKIKEIDAKWLEKHHTSTYDHALIRALKSSGMSLIDAMNYYVKHGNELKLDIKKTETGRDAKGDYMIDERTGKKVYY